AAEAVEFPVPGGGVLRGQRLGGGERWVLLVHEVGGDLDAWRPLAAWLGRRGFNVLAFDLPGHGASDDPWEPGLGVAAIDAAIDHARSLGAGQLHIAAAGSMCSAALAAAGADAVAVASPVLLSPRLEPSISARDSVREASLPKLIVVGSLASDAVARAEEGYRVAVGPCDMAQVPVREQGTELLRSDWADQAREKLLAHLLRRR